MSITETFQSDGVCCSRKCRPALRLFDRAERVLQSPGRRRLVPVGVDGRFAPGGVDQRPAQQRVEVLPVGIDEMPARRHWHVPAQALIAIAESDDTALAELPFGQNRTARFGLNQNFGAGFGAIHEVLEIREGEALDGNSPRDVVFAHAMPGRGLRPARLLRLFEFAILRLQIRGRQRR